MGSRHLASFGLTVVALVAAAACGGSDAAAPDRSDAAPATSVAVAPAPPPPVDPPPSAATSAPATTLAPVTAPGPGTAPATSTAAAEPTAPTSEPAAARPPSVDALLASGAVLNIAHAGGDQDHPHSTMFAFRQAVAAGADMLEMDVQLTADGALIVQHDADTEKTTEADLVVADTDLVTLQALDNAYWFSPQCWPCHDLAEEAYTFRGVRTGAVAPPPGYTADDFRIITLAELSAAFPALPFDVEIKGGGAAGLAVAAALADELARLDRLNSTVVASFDSDVIGAFHELAPQVAVSPGVNEMAAWLLGGAALPEHYRIVQIPPFYDEIEVLSPANLATAAAAGVAIWVWPNDASTQENETYYRELVAMGVDGIIAGRPAAAEAAIAGTG